MVRLHLKKGNDSLFLHDTTTAQDVKSLLADILTIYDLRLKVLRVCDEMQCLAKHGHFLPGNMQGLTDEQIEELKYKDEYEKICVPQGGSVECEDPIGRRTGKAPNEAMAEVLMKTITDAKEMVSNKLTASNTVLTLAIVKDALDRLKGAVMIVYPMKLPPYDPVQMEFENDEDLSGTQASLEVIEQGSLWWAGKELLPEKLLSDYVGKNEKTKVIVKLTKKGSSAPGREQVMTEEDKKQMMAWQYRKQEEMKKLHEADDGDDYYNSPWANSSNLKNQFHGIGNIKWGPK